MLGQGWQSQWKRVLTRLAGLRDVYTGRPGGTDEALDTALSFFESVHHLKDWLANDPSSGIGEATVESLIRRNSVLRICADLANGSKHLVLTRSRTGDTSTAIARNDVTIDLGAGTAAHRFYVQSGKKEYDVRDLAEEAVAIWTKFLTNQGSRVIKSAQATAAAWTEFMSSEEAHGGQST